MRTDFYVNELLSKDVLIPCSILLSPIWPPDHSVMIDFTGGGNRKNPAVSHRFSLIVQPNNLMQNTEHRMQNAERKTVGGGLFVAEVSGFGAEQQDVPSQRRSVG